jgi:hypothetical protein
MKSMLCHVDDHGKRYDSLAFVCPGCALERDEGIKDDDGKVIPFRESGLHMLPVNTDQTKPAWTFDGNEEAPTVSPSILTHHEQSDTDPRPTYVCHSFLNAGVFQFLGDCTHALAGQFVPMPDLPDWFVED